ncbi:MAG: SCP2 sterol-binding domain-containing protein [Candidatus Krumholzibacteriia bacterium]
MDCRSLFFAMAERFDPVAAGDWSAHIQFTIAGPRGGDFTVRIADGVCTVAEGDDPAATSRVKAGDDTWLGIVDGSVNPMTAFMTGRIKVSGNMGDVLKLQDPELFRRP